MSESNHPIHHRSKRIIKSFETEALKKRSLIVKIADYLTQIFGNFTFLIINLIFFAVWIFVNTKGKYIFDPFPFSLLTMIVSLEAIFLAIIVLISQNRETQRDVLRQELGLQVQLISEKEITKILRLFKLLLEKQEKHDPELDEMTTEIDASYIERKLEAQLEKSENIVKEVGEKIQEGISPKK